MRSWLWALGPVALYAGAIVLLSSQSEFPSIGLLAKLRYAFARSPFGFVGFDKIQHFVEYAIFAFLIARALQILGPTEQSRGRTWIVAASLGTLFGLTDEIHQYFVPKRDASLADLAADALGSGAGAAAWLMLRSFFRSPARTVEASDDPSMPV